jgi:putative transposase
MPRPPRDLAPGIQHVGVGAAGPANYFRDDIDHATWTRLFVRTLDRYHWKALIVCELSTHWHALVDVADDSLSVGMQQLNCEYSKRFNDRHGRVGYLVRDRYWSRRKETPEKVLAAFRYVARNPVEAGIVKRPELWFWSSYATTIGLADTFPWVDASSILDTLSADRREAIRRLRALVELA